MEPASGKALVEALTRKLLVYPSMRISPDERTAMLLAYAAELANLPGDLVLAAIRDWRGDYYPKAVEIIKSVEASREYRGRIAKVKALEQAAQPSAPRRERVTAEQAEAIRRRIDGSAKRMGGSL